MTIKQIIENLEGKNKKEIIGYLKKIKKSINEEN